MCVCRLGGREANACADRNRREDGQQKDWRGFSIHEKGENEGRAIFRFFCATERLALNSVVMASLYATWAAGRRKKESKKRIAKEGSCAARGSNPSVCLSVYRIGPG